MDLFYLKQSINYQASYLWPGKQVCQVESQIGGAVKVLNKEVLFSPSRPWQISGTESRFPFHVGGEGQTGYHQPNDVIWLSAADIFSHWGAWGLNLSSP